MVDYLAGELLSSAKGRLFEFRTIPSRATITSYHLSRGDWEEAFSGRKG
jgi:hypothetical protein